ncbi:MAG: YheT family hydrolase [Gammaproteobacteria bacterium]
MNGQVFHPPWLLRNAHVQTVVTGTVLRKRMLHRRDHGFATNARGHTLDCGGGVRLQGLHNRGDAERPLVVLLHGWEGCADSLYMRSAGNYLFERGFDVFRLNFRDHGSTQHLNRELFHSCRIEEVVNALGVVQRTFGDRPLLLGGFSLGGNFALRAALRAVEANVSLGGIFAVCPVLQPENTLIAMERGWSAYHGYFMRRWRRSLIKKHSCFPGDYDIDAMLANRNLREMTDYLVRHHTHFPDLLAYLHGYAITGDVLSELAVPACILAAEDDPIIPARDLGALAKPECLEIRATRLGGHCGYIEDYKLNSWSDGMMARWFASCAESADVIDFGSKTHRRRDVKQTPEPSSRKAQ